MHHPIGVDPFFQTSVLPSTHTESTLRRPLSTKRMKTGKDQVCLNSISE